MATRHRHGANQSSRYWIRGQDEGAHFAVDYDTQKFLRKSKERWDKRRREYPCDPIALRPMGIDDCAYVLDSWANSYRRSPATGPIEREIFNIEQRARINRLMSRPASRVMVACLQKDRHVIVGWICFEAPAGRPDGIPIVHYVCVKPANQLAGVATALIDLARQTAKDPSLPMWSTHETAPMRHIRGKWNVLFNPYLLELQGHGATVQPKDLRTK